MAGTNQPSQKPYSGGQSGAYSGDRRGDDPTTEPGQYPPASDGGIFGGPLPTGTGAPGTSGGGGMGDSTSEAGQLTDGLTGLADSDIRHTGAPGTSTSPGNSGGGTSITTTRPGSHLSGTYQSEVSSEVLSGPGESTEANGQGYGTGGPQLPGIEGNEPTAGGGRYQPGSGRVLRGGRSVRG
jgi:hypothetical protein